MTAPKLLKMAAVLDQTLKQWQGTVKVSKLESFIHELYLAYLMLRQRVFSLFLKFRPSRAKSITVYIALRKATMHNQ